MISTRTLRFFLSLAMVVTGFLVPILPRWIVPMIAPKRKYYDTLETLFEFKYLVETALLFLLTVLPFVVLAIVGWFHLAKAGLSPFERKARTIGVTVAYVLTLSIGLWVHTPKTAPGVNLGLFFFPLYAAVAMVLGYWIARGVAERLQGRER